MKPKKKGLRRRLVLASLIFLIFCLALFLTLILVVPSKRFSSWLLARVNQRLEQSYFLKIDAERLKLNPWRASLEATRLKVWSRPARNYSPLEKSPGELSFEPSSCPLFLAEKIAINLAMMPLFKRQFHFQEIYFDSPRFNLASPGIWKLPARPSTSGDVKKKERKKEGPWQFRVDRFQLENGALDLSLDQKIKCLTLEEIRGEIKSSSIEAKYSGRLSIGKGKAVFLALPEISLASSSFDFEVKESEALINSFTFQAAGLFLSGQAQIKFKPQLFPGQARVEGKINLEEIPWPEGLKTTWSKAESSFVSGSFPSGKINFSLEATGKENLLEGEARLEGKEVSFYFPLEPLQGSFNFKLPFVNGQPEVRNFMADFYLRLKESGQGKEEFFSGAELINFFEEKAISSTAQKSHFLERGQSEGGKAGSKVLREAPVLSGELKGKIKGKEIELNLLSLELAGLNFSSSGKLEASKKFQAKFELRADDLGRNFNLLKPYLFEAARRSQFLKEIMAEEKEDLISGELALKGTLGGLWPEINGWIHLDIREFQGPFWPAAELEAEAELKERRINLSRLEIFLPTTEFSASGFMSWPLLRDDVGEREKLDFLFRLKIDDLGKLAQTEELANFVQKKFIQKKDGGPVFFGGSLSLEGSLKGNLKWPLLSFKIQGKNLASEIENLAFLEAEGQFRQPLLTSHYQLKKTPQSLPITGNLTLDLRKKSLEATLAAPNQNLADFSWLQSRFPLQGQTGFQLEIRGERDKIEYFYKIDGNNIESPYFSIRGLAVSGRGLLRSGKPEEVFLRVNFEPPSFSLLSFPLQATGPFEFSLQSGLLSISGFNLKGENFSFQVAGTLGLEKMAGELNLEAKLPLKLIGDFLEPAKREFLAAQGELLIKGRIGGSLKEVRPDIMLSMSDGFFSSPFMRFPAEKINLSARWRADIFELEKFSFQLGQARVSAQARLPVEILLNEANKNGTERAEPDEQNEINSGKEKGYEEAGGGRGEFSLSFSQINPLDFLGHLVDRLPAEIRGQIERKEISGEIGGEIKLSLAPLKLPLPGQRQSLRPGQGQIFWADNVQELSPGIVATSQKVNFNSTNNANCNNNLANAVSILPRNLSQDADKFNKSDQKHNNKVGKTTFKKDQRAESQGHIQSNIKLNSSGAEFSNHEEKRFSVFRNDWLASLKGEGSLNPFKINLGKISLTNEKPITFRLEPDLITLEEATLKGESFQIIFGGEIKNPFSLKPETKDINEFQTETKSKLRTESGAAQEDVRRSEGQGGIRDFEKEIINPEKTNIDLAKRIKNEDKGKNGISNGKIRNGLVMDFYVQAAGNLEPLSSWLEGISLRGKVALNFRFSGSPSSLKPHGSIELREISLELLDWPLRLNNSTGYFFFNGRRLEIRSFRGLVNGTPWEIAGFFALDDRGRIDSGFLQLEAREIPLEMEDLGGSLVSLGLRLEPRKPGWLLGGEVRLKKTSITAEIGQIPRLSRSRTMLPARAGQRALPSSLENLALQVRLNLDEPVVISNSFLQASLAGALTLTGNLSQPVLLGRLINSGQGEFIWAERRYCLEKMEVDFPGLFPPEPRLDILARTELVHRYDELSVRLSLSGPVSELRFSLQSTPPRSQEELAFLLLTGKIPEEIRAQGIGALREQVLLALATPTASRLGGAMRRLFGVEEARIEPLGIAGETDPGARLTLVKEITPATRITSSIDITNSQRQSWMLDYRLTRGLLFQGFRLDDGSYGAGLRHSFSLGGGKIAGMVAGERKKEKAEEKRVIASVQIEGNPVFSEAEIRKKISRLRPGRSFTSSLLDREIKSLESFYRKNKYLQVRIEPKMEIRDKGGVEIVLAIQAGPKIELNFEGASISKSLRWRMERIWAREIAPERAATRIARLIENYLKGRGYFRAEVTYELMESGLKEKAFPEMNKAGLRSGENEKKRSSPAQIEDIYASKIKSSDAEIYSWRRAKTESGIKDKTDSGKKAEISRASNEEKESGKDLEIDSIKKAGIDCGKNTEIEVGEKTQTRSEESLESRFGEKSETTSWKKPGIESGERAATESAVNKEDGLKVKVKQGWREKKKLEMDKDNTEKKEKEKIDEAINGKVDEIRINFRIRPGERYRMGKIEIEGAAPGRKKELLQAIKGWRTEEAKGPFLFLLEPRAVLEAIRSFYEERGYLEARASAEIREDEKLRELYVNLKIDEGRLSRVAEIKIEGPQAIAPSPLESVIGSQTGRPFNPDQVSAERQNLLAFYRARGFREARVSARVEMVEGGPDVRLIFQIEEGRLHEVSSVEFSGIEESRMRKLAEIFGLKRGEALTLEKISQGQKALYDTGDFSLVQVMTEPETAEPGKQRVRVEVRSEPALSVRYGLRYNSEDKTEVVAGLDFRHLLGVGRHGLINYLQNERERDFRFSFHDRSFLGLKVESLLSFYLTRRKDASFTTDETGASWRHQLTLPGKIVLSTVLRRSRIHTYEAEPSGPFPFDISLSLTEFSLQAVRDTRDDPLDARRGSFFSSSLTYSPEALKSELTYLSWFGQATFYQPVGERAVLASNFRLGLATAFDQVMVPARRFYAGGSYSLRGFRQDRVGPYDPYLERPEGGESVFIFNQELRYRLLPGLDGVLFYDAGNVFSEVKNLNLRQLRHSLGLGLRLRSPVGLLRFDLGFNLRPKPGEPRQVFFFSLGQIF